jgi:hypothetical protein
MNTITRIEQRLKQTEQAIDLLRNLQAGYLSDHFHMALRAAIFVLDHHSNELQYELAELYDINSESHDQ